MKIKNLLFILIFAVLLVGVIDRSQQKTVPAAWHGQGAEVVDTGVDPDAGSWIKHKGTCKIAAGDRYRMINPNTVENSVLIRYINTRKGSNCPDGEELLLPKQQVGRLTP